MATEVGDVGLSHVQDPARSKQSSIGGSTEDLAGGLFNKKHHALASVIRDLQQRSKRARQNKIGPREIQTSDDRVQLGMPEPTIEQNDRELELGNGGSLWVLGGASTVIDVHGATRVEGVDGMKAANRHQPEEADPAVPGAAVDPIIGKDTGTKYEVATPPPWRPRLRPCSWGIDVLQELVGIIRLYPSTLIIPLLVFLFLAGLGIWGVMAGSAAYVKQQKDDVRSRAVDAATGFQIQLQQSFTPGVTFQLLVKQQPRWGFWLKNFNQTAQELLSRVPNGALWNLQLQPFAQVMMIHPFRQEDESQINPPRDLIGDPTRRDGILGAIKNREPVVNGPFSLQQGFLGAFVRYPIYVPDVEANETFGFRYRDNTSDIPYSELPASVRSCSVCYNNVTREKWWGILTVLVNYDAVTHGQDAYLANLRKMNLQYELVRPINSTDEQVIYRTNPALPLRGTDAVTVDVKVITGVWLLRVAPQRGFEPPWRGPLIAAVIIIALIITILLFVSTASFKRQMLLLKETVAANHKLAETTEQLREEKERMDVLLIRQYDLLKCLDANRTKGKDGDEAAGGSRKAMMARIEDARRSLNVAKASVEDPIQVFEVLGAGAFGKVQRGLWRGTVVAVKTMILPANMTGQEKREKMAVMEAAISSSLVHPNIVTTYTYFIRPYHEPMHEGIQQMTSQYNGTSLSGRSNGSDPTAHSVDPSQASEAAVHSYEVRLVLEFCDKGSLKDALDQNVFMEGALNLAAMLETAADVAKAMVHMHAANVLHSDLKARNIMLKSSGTEGRGVVAKVADFGLSTRMEHQETHLSSCFQGTLTHMAPEVMMEGRISKAADVYSFGILMWELFCAGDPFAGVPRAHMGHAITKECRRPKFPPFAPRDYVALAARCWDPDAARRPSFEQVLAELVHMRDQLGGETRPLNVMKPQLLQRNPSNDRCSRNGSIAASSLAQVGASGGGGGGTDRAGLQFAGRGDGGGGGGRGCGGGGITAAPFRGLLGRSISANGASMSTNPFVLYRAGVLVGDSCSDGSDFSSGDSVPGVQELMLGYGSVRGVAGHVSSSGMRLLARSASASDRASRAQRARLKALLLERQMRKLGLHMSSRSSLRPAISLPVLDEDDGELRSSALPPGDEPPDTS